MKKLLSLGLTCLLFACALLGGLSAPSAHAAGDVQNVRIQLRRLALTDRADLTLDGAYLCTADHVTAHYPRGTVLTVQVSGDRLVLTADDITLRVEGALRLTRTDDGRDSGGIRFRRDGNLYPGDLTLTVENGQLQPVLTIPVEDYLLGVVPYEMNDSFPMEALKAQAICARTYALSHIDPSKPWDMTDTTNDQVFHGVNPRDRRAAQAVEETRGVVGMYKGKLATCYYSASNGGQTELVENVWSGRGAPTYYQMVDDPYDLENPESIVRRATLRKNASGLPEAFTAILCDYMAQEMLRQGFEPQADCFRVDAIDAVSVGHTVHPAPSRFVNQLTLTFRWSGRGYREQIASVRVDEEDLNLFETPEPTATVSPEPEATPAPQLSGFLPADDPATLTLPLFPEVVKALNLSIAGSANEMITVVEEGDAFRLESRRFGHGVGMSQRGAQWMAARYGMRCEEILAFYYPGMDLMVGGTEDAPLPTPDPVMFYTPGPAATATPRPTLMPVTAAQLPEGAWLASVEGIDDDSSLNLRAEPTQAAQILMRLYKHQRLIVLETCEDPVWVHVKTDVIEGYVMVGFLEQVTAE